MKSEKICLHAFIVSLIMAMLTFSGIMNTQTANAKTVKKNGYYKTALIKNYPKSDLYFMGNSPVLKKCKLSKRKIITYGSYKYSKTISSTQTLIKKNKRTFQISSKCTYWDNAFSPSESAEKISRKEFFAYVKASMKRNMPAEDIMFTVKNGKIVKMEIGQG